MSEKSDMEFDGRGLSVKDRLLIVVVSALLRGKTKHSPQGNSQQ